MRTNRSDGTGPGAAAVPPPFISHHVGGWVGVPAMSGLPHNVQVLVRRVHGVPQLLGLRLEPSRLAYGADEIDEWPDDPDELEQLLAELLDAWIANAEQSGEGVAITTDLLRSLPLSKLKEAALADAEGGDAFEPFRRVEPGPGGRWPDEHYFQVAEIYRRAVANGESPLNAIATNWNVSRPSASKYVKQARERGFLGYPTRPGVAGESEPTSPIGKWRKQRPARAKRASKERK